MFQQIKLQEVEKELAFVARAKVEFEKSPSLATYGDLTSGSFLAMRWGMTEDCILVVKLDEDFEPKNYVNVIQKEV